MADKPTRVAFNLQYILYMRIWYIAAIMLDQKI